MNKHEVGTSPRLLVEFKDTAYEPYSPSAIALKIKEPDGTITTKAIGDLTEEETGKWYYVFIVSQKGLHKFRYVGAGPDYDIAVVNYFKGTDEIGS